MPPPDPPAFSVSTSPILVLDVIGGVRATVDGRAVVLPSRLIRALLAAIALADNHQAPREKLWGLFWGESGQHNAQASLRQVIRKLRHSLEEAGYTAHRFEPVWLALGDDTVRVDLHEVLAAARQHSVHPLLRTTRDLPDALLGDVYDLNEDVTSWVLELRADVAKALADALEEGLANPSLDRDRRQDVAEALLRLNPCHEAACRALMRLRAEAGDPAGAERAFLDLQAALDARLDDLPSSETVDEYARIKGRLDTTPAAPRSPAAFQPAAPPPAEPGVPSVAVLAFATPDDATLAPYFARGLAEEMTAALAAFDEIAVISRNSTASLESNDRDRSRAARELGVRYLVSGTVRRHGDQLRLRAELSDITTGRVAWTNVFPFTSAELFDVLDSIVAGVVGIVAPRIRSAEIQRTRLKRPENFTAYDHVLRGLDLISRLEQPAFASARQHFEQAIALDPGYAMAHALAGEWHSLQVGQGWTKDPSHDREAGMRLLQAALDRDPTNARALAVMGHDRAFLFRDYDGAIALFDRAEAVSPGSAMVWSLSAATYAYIDQGAEAVRRIRKAKSLSPQDLFAFRQNTILAIAHYAVDEFAEALHWGRVALAQNPRYSATLRFLAASAVAAGDLAAAQEHAAQLLVLEPGFTVSAYRTRCPYRDGDRVELMCRRLLAAGLPT